MRNEYFEMEFDDDPPAPLVGPLHPPMPEAKDLRRAVYLNRRRLKYRKMIGRLRLYWFIAEDAGKLDRLKQTIKRCERIAHYGE